MTITNRATLIRMQKNPNRVTIFGASHNGNSSTNAFHYISFLESQLLVIC